MFVSELLAEHPVSLCVSEGSKNLSLDTTIAHIVGDCALLEPILSDGKFVGFPDTCSVSFQYPEGGKLHVWENVTVKLVKYEKKPYIIVKLPGESIILNRRTSFRVYVGKEMKFACFTSTGPNYFSALVKDISETGISFISKDSYDVGRMVKVSLPMQKGQALQLGCMIVRTIQNNNGTILHGCRFQEKNRFLPNYIMSLQQERQKEKMGVSRPVQ